MPTDINSSSKLIFLFLFLDGSLCIFFSGGDILYKVHFLQVWTSICYFATQRRDWVEVELLDKVSDALKKGCGLHTVSFSMFPCFSIIGVWFRVVGSIGVPLARICGPRTMGTWSRDHDPWRSTVLIASKFFPLNSSITLCFLHGKHKKQYFLRKNK